MKTIYLLPPSEGKNMWWVEWEESTSFSFKKPVDIWKNATEKDLKCSGKRYEEGIELNSHIQESQKLSAISRYSGVMYNAIDYTGMTEGGRQYFDEHFLILSGMYGILRPSDMIGNYKLPVETKWLKDFWGDHITDALNNLDVDMVVDLLPGSYAKMIQWKEIQATVVRINFLHTKNGELKKMTHGVKKVKGEYIKKWCEMWGIDTWSISDRQETIIDIVA